MANCFFVDKLYHPKRTCEKHRHFCFKISFQDLLNISQTYKVNNMRYNYYNSYYIRGVIDKFVSFFHRIIIYGWIYIIFCHYQQQSVISMMKTLKCKVRQTCDVTMTLMTSHVGDVVVKALEDGCGWCTLSGYKCCSTCAIIVNFSDNICTSLLNAAQVN